MKVLHVGYVYGTNGTGGAAIGAARLHQKLLDRGIESRFVCVVQTEAGAHVIVAPPLGSVSRKIHMLLAKIARNIWRFTPIRRKVDIDVVPIGLRQIVAAECPDIIQIHQIGADTLRLEELHSIPVPMIITLHDLWMINGFDPYPYSDRRFVDGFTRSNSGLIENWLWRRKKRISQVRNVTYIAPSAWASEQARLSAIARNQLNFVVPYFIGSAFSYDTAKRISHQRFRILFGCNCGIENPFKGFCDLREALLSLPHDIQADVELHVFGDNRPDFMIGGVEVHVCGIIRNAYVLASLYHTADIFAFPSRTETQGLVKIEAMMCGLPAIAFDRTACAEGIIHKETGWVAQDGDIASFRDGILYFYDLYKRGELDPMRQSIAKKMNLLYNDDAILDRVMGVYDETIRKGAGVR